MNKKGFSLVELLAVIVVLAIIAMIATPIILSVISDSREGAIKDSIEGIYHAIEIDYSDELNFSGEATYNYSDGKLYTGDGDNKRQVKINGNLGDGAVAKGTVKNGDVKVAAFVNGRCYTKLDNRGLPKQDETKTSQADCLAVAD